MCDAGWALCGHETPAGEADEEAAVSSPGASAPSQQQPSAASQDQASCCAAAGLAGAGCSECSSTGAQAGKRANIDATNGDHAHDHCISDAHVVPLSRAERMALGQKCKRLIDAGRVQWLAEQGFQASLSLKFHIVAQCVLLPSMLTSMQLHTVPEVSTPMLKHMHHVCQKMGITHIKMTPITATRMTLITQSGCLHGAGAISVIYRPKHLW